MNEDDAMVMSKGFAAAGFALMCFSLAIPVSNAQIQQLNQSMACGLRLMMMSKTIVDNVLTKSSMNIEHVRSM